MLYQIQKTPLGCWIGRYSRFTFVKNTISNLPKVPRAKFLGSNGLFLLAYASLAASRTFLQWLLACLSFTLESEELSFWCKQKKWFLWTMAAAQAAENYGDEWGLTWYFLYSMTIIVWSLSRKTNHLGMVITEFTKLINSTRISKPVLMIDVKVSKNKNISRWVHLENLVIVRTPHPLYKGGDWPPQIWQ